MSCDTLHVSADYSFVTENRKGNSKVSVLTNSIKQVTVMEIGLKELSCTL